MRSVLDRDSEHLLPWPNVFMLALAVSPEWVPDVFFFFFFFFAQDLRLGETSRCCANHQIIHTNRHHLMSRTTPSKRNYIHLNLSSPSAKETRGKKTRLPSIYGKCKPQRQKWDMCKLLWMHSALCDECSMYNTGGEEGVPYLCPLYLYHSGFEKGEKNQRDALSKQPANFFCQSATFSYKIVDITVINMQLLVWGRRSSWSRNRTAIRCRDRHRIGLTDYWDFKTHK